jgi:two-component system, OmpR family, sensor kinase
VDVLVAVDRAAAERQGGEVIVEPPGEDVPEAAVSAGVLDRIVTNLVDNALTHGRPPVTIRVRGVAGDECGWVCLQVRDAGDGMEPALLATATGRFTRASEARSRPGAGLGLALVDALVARTGGELRLCHAGHHQPCRSVQSGVRCDHGPEMTVTVLVRAARSG